MSLIAAHWLLAAALGSVAGVLFSIDLLAAGYRRWVSWRFFKTEMRALERRMLAREAAERQYWALAHADHNYLLRTYKSAASIIADLAEEQER